MTAAVSQIDVMIVEDLLPLGRRESEAISRYAELEQHCQRQKRPARVIKLADRRCKRCVVDPSALGEED